MFAGQLYQALVGAVLVFLSMAHAACKPADGPRDGYRLKMVVNKLQTKVLLVYQLVVTKDHILTILIVHLMKNGIIMILQAQKNETMTHMVGTGNILKYSK